LIKQQKELLENKYNSIISELNNKQSQLIHSQNQNLLLEKSKHENEINELKSKN